MKRPAIRHSFAALTTTMALAGSSLVVVAVGVIGRAASAGATITAQAEYQNAEKLVGKLGVHFSSSATQGTMSVQAEGDTGTTTGTERLSFVSPALTAHMTVLVIGSTGYLNGDATALHRLIGLGTTQSSKAANKWLSFPTSDKGLGQLVNGLLDSQVSREITMNGPYRYGSPSVLAGQHALAIEGSVTNSDGTKVPTVLYVPSQGRPLPLAEVTNPGHRGSSLHGTVDFSNWGEVVSQQKPAHTVSLLSLAPSGQSGGSTATG